MNRHRFKFRVWDHTLRRMEYSGFFSLSCDGKLYYGNACFDAYRVELMRYTFICDKNGKEIYEGDIINTPQWYGENYFVHLKQGKCGPCVGDNVMQYILASDINCPEKDAIWNLWNGSEVEVIGNIYENPELLEEANYG